MINYYKVTIHFTTQATLSFEVVALTRQEAMSKAISRASVREATQSSMFSNVVSIQVDDERYMCEGMRE